jgi:hypothetical protein
MQLPPQHGWPPPPQAWQVPLEVSQTPPVPQAVAPWQHGWPTPPQVVQACDAQTWVPEQLAHICPPMPHDESASPPRHWLPLQQPAHDDESHVHMKFMQCRPLAHEPSHRPLQPSDAPQGLSVQSGMQAPASGASEKRSRSESEHPARTSATIAKRFIEPLHPLS